MHSPRLPFLPAWLFIVIDMRLERGGVYALLLIVLVKVDDTHTHLSSGEWAYLVVVLASEEVEVGLRLGEPVGEEVSGGAVRSGGASRVGRRLREGSRHGLSDGRVESGRWVLPGWETTMRWRRC